MTSKIDDKNLNFDVKSQLSEISRKGAQLEVKISALDTKISQQEKRSKRYGIWIPILSALLGAIAGISTGYLDYLPSYQEVMKTYLSGLESKNYYSQLHAMREIASVHGTKIAVEIGRHFRTGATIRALEEIKEDNKYDGKKSTKGIDRVLEFTKRVLIIDSIIQENIYDDFTKMLAGSNVDDIAEQIRELPIRIIGMKVDSTWDSEKEDQAIKLEPDLIIMHLGSFEKIIDTPDIDSCSTFIVKISQVLPKTHFLVYSRQGKYALSNMKSAVKEKLELKGIEYQLENRISMFELLGAGAKKKFSHAINSNRLKIAVSRILDLEKLYERSWN